MTYDEALNKGFPLVQHLALEALGEYGKNMLFEEDEFTQEIDVCFEYDGEKYSFYISLTGQLVYNTDAGWATVSVGEFNTMLGVLCG